MLSSAITTILRSKVTVLGGDLQSLVFLFIRAVPGLVLLLNQSTIVEWECKQVLHVFVVAFKDQIPIVKCVRDEIQATSCLEQHEVYGDAGDQVDYLVDKGDDGHRGVTFVYN